MEIKYNCINYGLPGRHPKLSRHKTTSKKTVISKYVLKNVELFNPEPMPYQKDTFKPCTVSRLVDIPRRLNDGFMFKDDLCAPKQRGVIFHRDRYDWSSMKDIIRSPNERLVAEENYIKRVKLLKSLSEQKLKSPNYNLILEGENLFPVNVQERYDMKKEKYAPAIEEDSFRHAAPTMVTNYNMSEEVSDGIEMLQPVSMDVHRIKLNSRQFGVDNISSAPLQNQNNYTSGEGMQNMYDGRGSLDRLPPITNRQKEFEQNFYHPPNSQTDFDYSFRQSERSNGQHVKLNEYFVGGVPMKFMERADIQAELRFLRSLALPTTARDLYIGRGIHLPANHATKNPRGRTLEDYENYVSDVNSHLKFETPGGGSVTINTKTSTVRNLAPDSSQVTNIPKEREIVDQQPDQDEMKELKAVEKQDTEDKYNILFPNDDSFADTEKFIDCLHGMEGLSEEEISFFVSPLLSTDSITNLQVNAVMQSVKILMNAKRPFREGLFPIDQSKVQPLYSQWLVFLSQSTGSINAATYYEWLIKSLDVSLTIDYCKEIYLRFQENVESNEGYNEEDIPQGHVLLFVPFLLHSVENK